MEDTQKALELALAQLDKEFGRGTVMRLGSADIPPWPSISTGALSLDVALGIGGLPRGRIVEIYGPESSGKSTLCLSLVAEAQRAGGMAAYIDVEHALDPKYMKALGVNLDDLLLAQPGHGEEALAILDTLIGTGAFSVIIVDSVAALTPKAELEGDIGDSHMGLQARLMGHALRKINGKANESKTLVVFTNQLRDKIGIVFGNPETTPGGKALRFYASVRIDIRKIGDIKAKDDGRVIGSRVKAKTVKNKMAPALRLVEFDILYGKGPNNYGCILDLAEERGIIQKSGAWYSYNGEQLGQGRDKTIEAFASDLEMTAEIKEKVLSAVRNS